MSSDLRSLATATVVANFESPLGCIRMLFREGALCGLYLPSQWKEMEELGREAQWMPLEKGQIDEPVVLQTRRWLQSYFAGGRTPVPPVLVVRGTPFQRAVWHELQTIGFGETRTYGQIARIIGNAKAVRAVGKAIGDNPISIIIPCHRVIGANGALTGFAGGLAAKKWLLEHEGLVGGCDALF